jgi:hypothetical protein
MSVNDGGIGLPFVQKVMIQREYIMNRSHSHTHQLRPQLEILEARDLPSVAGELVAFYATTYANQAAAAAQTPTNNLQTDFNTLQSNIQNTGATSSATTGSLAKASADYGKAEGNYAQILSTIKLAEQALFVSYSSGVFDQSDSTLLFYTFYELNSLQTTIANDAAIARMVATTPFAGNAVLDGQTTLAGVTGQNPI